jgi:hypothetical protein
MTQSHASGDAFNDSLNFVKKLWGQMGVPGMTSAPGISLPGMAGMQVPSMSLEDLDKRIQELKTVETWLNLNTTMLRNTIQAMEVQRATIATLHSLSNTMANTMQSMGSAAAAQSAPVEEEEPSQGDGEPVAPILEQSAAWWQGVQDQFKQALGAALEKSAANFDAVKSASETVVKPPTAKKTAARRKAASKPKAAVKARAPASRTRKAG